MEVFVFFSIKSFDVVLLSNVHHFYAKRHIYTILIIREAILGFLKKVQKCTIVKKGVWDKSLKNALLPTGLEY